MGSVRDVEVEVYGWVAEVKRSISGGMEGVWLSC